ncbi:uncharacterized protein ACHE_41191S [Aspergillus chevalieri]|uniref:Uncharacterized protein n=1 Tax=Aspergillus chevalieri TaxID=182096 RepID=A0A7R7VQ41_ASPCH|nr:uncharacterized protein ACHE_41191S [Aspergillus chevalieri]BCR88627.1 hypothetical protein ACHE_41191S [Aspergillus chevalieri]
MELRNRDPRADFPMQYVLLHDKRAGMTLVQGTRVQDLSGRRTNKIDLQVSPVQHPQHAVTVIIRICKFSIRRLISNRAKTFDITRATGNNIHRGLRIRHVLAVCGSIDDGEETLGIMYVSEDTEVDSITVEEALESFLARFASARTRGVPWTMSSDNHPWRDSSVHTGKIGLEEVQLLTAPAERTAVQPGRSILPIRRVGKVGFGVDHHDVGHAILEGIPKWWVR